MANRNRMKALIPFLLVAAMATIGMLLCLSSSTDPSDAQDRVWNKWVIGSNMAYKDQNVKTRELAKILKKAATDDRTVIITTLNETWAMPGMIFDLFIETFHIGEHTEELLKNLVVVATDPKAFDRCRSLHNNCYLYDLSSKQRNKSHWRLEFLRSVLVLGYNLVYTDLDILWLRNPFGQILNGGQISISADYYSGNPVDPRNIPNYGFLYVKASSQTIEFYKYWILATSLYPDKNEQQIFDIIRQDRYTIAIVAVRYLDTNYFSGFCQPGKDLNQVCTMHASCCIGMENKIHDLRVVIESWKNYTSKPEHERRKDGFSW